MSDRYFLDTNIFVYEFHNETPSKTRKAEQLIHRGAISRAGVVSYQVVQEFFNVVLRKFAHPMSTSEAEQYLTVIFRPMLVVNASIRLYMQAIALRERYHLPWYDALILTAAMQAGCHTLYSEDFQHGQQFGSVRVVNPFV